MRVSFLGLGGMGHPMAASLLKAGLDLIVWNRTPERAAALVAAGATLAPRVADAARAEVVISMVADDAALEAITFESGLIDLLAPGSIHVSMSTISIRLAERLTASHAARGSTFVSAPVFGRPDAAAAGKLFIVAAGSTGALERCEPLFAIMGQQTFRVGEVPSAANVVKLSGNFLIGAVIESLAEAIALVRKSGVNPHTFVELLTTTLFAAPVYKTYGGLIAAERYRPAGFRLPLGLKDVTLALEAGRDAMVPLPLASLLRDHLIAAMAQGNEDADWSVLGALAAKNAGL